jgi:tetratricopeptide (TPR) repeat protein
VLVFAISPLRAEAEPRSPDAKERARALVERGNQAFKHAHYEEAAEAFLEAERVIEANDLTPKPELYYNAGLAYERLDQCERTAQMYEKFLSMKPDAANPDLKYRVKKAAECAPEIEISTDPGGADVVIDGVERGKSPLRVRVRAGAHRLRLALEGHSAIEEEVTINAKDRSPIARRFDAAPSAQAERKVPLVEATAPAETEQPGPWTRRMAWMSGGTGVAALGTGVVLAILSQTALNRRDEEIAKGPGNASDRVVRDEESRAESLAWGRNVAIATGAVGLITSGVLFYASGVSPPSRAEGDGGQVTVVPVKGGAEAQWRFSW